VIVILVELLNTQTELVVEAEQFDVINVSSDGTVIASLSKEGFGALILKGLVICIFNVEKDSSTSWLFGI